LSRPNSSDSGSGSRSRVRLRDDRSARAYRWACGRGPRTAATKVGRCAAGWRVALDGRSRVVASSTKSVGSPRSWSAADQGDGLARELAGVCGALEIAVEGHPHPVGAGRAARQRRAAEHGAALHDQHGPVHAVTTVVRTRRACRRPGGRRRRQLRAGHCLAADRPVHRPDVEATGGAAGKGDRAPSAREMRPREGPPRVWPADSPASPCPQHSAADEPMVASRPPAAPRCR
jgi:hypothetical protein